MSYNLRKNALANSILAMEKGGHIPKRHLNQINLQNLDQLLHIHAKQKFQEWSCTTCGITVYGPKMLLIAHHKIHADKRIDQDKNRENEIFQKDYKLY